MVMEDVPEFICFESVQMFVVQFTFAKSLIPGVVLRVLKNLKIIILFIQLNKIYTLINKYYKKCYINIIKHALINYNMLSHRLKRFKLI